MTFDKELVVLHTKPSMFGKKIGGCLEVMQRFEQKTFYISSLRVKLILANSILLGAFTIPMPCVCVSNFPCFDHLHVF